MLKVIPTIIYLCLVSVLMYLGFWQLDRSDQKRAFLEQQKQALSSTTLQMPDVIASQVTDLKYRQLEITGRYDTAHQFLIDNQISDGKAGYFVLTPLILSGEAGAILVNRGWIPLNLDRKSVV